MSRLVVAVHEAGTRNEAAVAYRELFGPLRTGQEYRGLKTDSHPGLAFRAAWEEVVTKSGMVSEHDEGKPLDQTLAARFIGFAEGRLQVNAPAWWEDGVRRARLGPKRTVTFGKPQPAQAWRLDTSLHVFAGPDIEAKRQDAQVTLTQSGKTVALSRRQFEAMREDSEAADILLCRIDEESSIIGLCKDIALPYELYCFARESGKVRWKATVWAALNGRVVPQFRSWHLAEICLRERRALIFGMSEYSAYIEVFDNQTGAPLIRCSTSY